MLPAVAFIFLATDSICSQDAAESEAAKHREAVPLSLGRILVRPMGLAGPASYFPAEAFILTARPLELVAAKGAGVKLTGPRQWTTCVIISGCGVRGPAGAIFRAYFISEWRSDFQIIDIGVGPILVKPYSELLLAEELFTDRVTADVSLSTHCPTCLWT